MKEQIVLNGYWPKFIASVWTLILTAALAGSWVAAARFGELTNKVEAATGRMDALLMIHEEDQEHIAEDHQEFRNRLHSLEVSR